MEKSNFSLDIPLKKWKYQNISYCKLNIVFKKLFLNGQNIPIFFYFFTFGKIIILLIVLEDLNTTPGETPGIPLPLIPTTASILIIFSFIQIQI